MKYKIIQNKNLFTAVLPSAFYLKILKLSDVMKYCIQNDKGSSS